MNGLSGCSHIRMRGVLVWATAAVVVLLGAGMAQAKPPPQLSVEGNRLVDPAGETVRLLGVNRSGTEYACAHRFGFFDSPDPEQVDTGKMIRAIRGWGANAVRVPLNEHCWLGINGVPKRFGGEHYRDAITTYVRRLKAEGIHAILDLHQVGAGDLPARLATDGLRPMPDEDHAIDFWRSVAERFGNDRSVVFDLYNEPHRVGWKCLRDGCTVKRDDYRPDFPEYEAVGMAKLVHTVRRAGAQNVLLIPGVSYSNDLSRWLEFVPNDPLGRIAASFHNYEGPTLGGCYFECWEEQGRAGRRALPRRLGRDRRRLALRPRVQPRLHRSVHAVGRRPRRLLPRLDLERDPLRHLELRRRPRPDLRLQRQADAVRARPSRPPPRARRPRLTRCCGPRICRRFTLTRNNQGDAARTR